MARVALSFFAVVLVHALALGQGNTDGKIQFEEVTASAGLSHEGQSWGAAWGDFNGSEYPDLWVGNHFAPPSLYLNLQGKAMVDIARVAAPPPNFADEHGAAWADFDGDGDEDLIELVGAQGGTGLGPNHVFVNGPVRRDGELAFLFGSILVNRAPELGLEYPLARGRTPLWFDWDRDGRLDVLLTNEARPGGEAPPAVFRQTPAGFVLGNALAGFQVASAKFALLSDVSGDGKTDLLLGGDYFPRRIFDYSTLPFTDRTTSLGFPTTYRVIDAVLADFTGDLRPDAYLASYRYLPDAVQVSPGRIEAELVADQSEVGIRFSAPGVVRFAYVGNNTVTRFDIFLGSHGVHPSTKHVIASPTDPTVVGIAPHVPGVSNGIYIGYEPDRGEWTLLHSWSARHPLPVLVASGVPTQGPTTIGFEPFRPTVQDRFLVATTGAWVDQTVAAGLAIPSSAVSVVAGDFDNDMDLDLYVVRTGPVENLPNRVWENLGHGTFVEVPGAGGAAGSLQGRGNGVVVADYDLDGFLDLFVVNGDGVFPFDFDGPHQLFHNLGNSNHWIEIDLQGVQSDPHGIGARVTVTAGDVTQLREQGGGIHFGCQNHRRLHFGLGTNTMVTSLEIRWPSGVVQRLAHVPANQVLRVVERRT